MVRTTLRRHGERRAAPTMSEPHAAQTISCLADPPHPVRQSNFDPGKGNALQACIASLFGTSLESVPNFVDLECGYERGIKKYCHERGFTMRKVVLGGAQFRDVIYFGQDGFLCILRGKSPRGDHGHVVVARVAYSKEKEGFDMVHDPHPDDTFLDAREAYGWCMFFEKLEKSWTAEEEIDFQEQFSKWMAEQACEICGSTCHVPMTLRGRPYMPYVDWHQMKSDELGWGTLKLLGCNVWDNSIEKGEKRRICERCTDSQH